MDYRLKVDYSLVEIELHNKMLEFIKKNESITVRGVLKSLGKPKDLEALKNVLKHLYQYSDVLAISVISKMKKIWRKK